MPGFTFTNYSPIKGQPARKNLEALSKSLATIDEKDIRARETASAIQQSLAQIQLNAAEDKWKNNYIQNIEDEIGKHVKGGDYSGALGVAKSLAGKALSDGGLLGRIRANADYETALKTVNARNDISQVTKDRWKEENPYTYSDIKDSKGNVVAGTKWESNWNPVSRVDTMHYLGMLKQFVSPDKGQGDSAMFVDENGNLTSDPGKNFYGMAVKTTTGYERLSEAKLKQTWNAMLKSNPQIKASILQDYDDAKWLLGKSKDKDGKDFLESSITDNQGNVLTPEQYLASIVNPTIKNMAYNHVHVSHEYGNGQAAYRQARATQNAQLSALGMTGGRDTVFAGMNVQENAKEEVENAAKNLSDAFGVIEKLIPGLTNSKHNRWNNAKNNRDYNSMKNIALNFVSKGSNAYNRLNPQQKVLFNKAFSVIGSEGNVLNGVLNRAGDAQTQNDILTNLALNNNSLLPANNSTGRLIKAKNAITQNGTFGKIRAEFADIDELFGAIKKSGLSPEELKNNGVDLTQNNGKYSISFDSSNPLFYKLANAIGVQDQEVRFSDFVPSVIRTVGNWLGGNFTRERTKIYGIDNKGKETRLKGKEINAGFGRHMSDVIRKTLGSTIFPGGGVYNNIGDSYNYATDAPLYEGNNVFGDIVNIMSEQKKKTDKFFETPNLVNNTEIMVSDFYGLEDAQAYEQVRRGLMSEKDYYALQDKYKNNLINGFTSADLAKAKKVYMQIGDETFARELSDAEKTQYNNLISNAKRNNALQVQIANKDGKVGYFVQIPQKLNSKGEPIGDHVRMFIPMDNFSYSSAQRYYDKDTKAQSMIELSRLSRYNGTYISPIGTVVSNVDSKNNSAVINGLPSTKDDALKVINEGLIIDNLMQEYALGNPNFNNMLQLAATEINPTSDAKEIQKTMASILSVIQSKLQ